MAYFVDDEAGCHSDSLSKSSSLISEEHSSDRRFIDNETVVAYDPLMAHAAIDEDVDIQVRAMVKVIFPRWQQSLSK